jgi:hypothetical protein
MRWRSLLFKVSLLAFLVLLLADPGAARGNTTPGIYPGTVKDVCVGDTIFVGETGLNLTPLTPYARGEVRQFRKYVNDNPDMGQLADISVHTSTSFDVPPVPYYGVWYPVIKPGGGPYEVLKAYSIQIKPYTPQYPANVVITSSKEWMVANEADYVSLTISVTDTGNNPIPGAGIQLSASAPWGLSDTILKTDSSGKAHATLLPTFRSGTAVITASASVQGVTTSPVSTTLIQKIDAGTPAYIWPLYYSSATVASPADIYAFVFDRNLNPVTSLRDVKNVTFQASRTGTGFFLDGTDDHLKEISVPLNESGLVKVTYFLSTTQGNNFIYLVPPDPITGRLINIIGIGNSVPFSISQTVNPAGNPPFILADESAQATMDYYLFDKWGNPAADQGVQIVTSAGENRIFYTNGEGHLTVFYGPKSSAGFYSLTASATGNASVRISQTLQFGSLDPTDMLLTASPQTMASLDVNPTMSAQVIAKVIDDRGNPVRGETVTFSRMNASSAFKLTQAPSIGSGGVTTAEPGAPIPVLTDENGQAILHFFPGAFPTLGNEGWSETASATTTVNASWDGPAGMVSRSIDLSFKNYPFLSVYTEVNPKTVEKGGYVAVSVRLKGDGWALQPKPIDVVLCTDRSSTMLINESVSPKPDGYLVQESVNDRMVDAMIAARTFVNQTTANDRVALVTFGDPSPSTIGYAILNKTFNPTMDKYMITTAWRVGRDFDCRVGKKCNDPNNQDRTNQMPDIQTLYPGHGLTGRDYRVNGVMTGAYVEANLSSTKTQVLQAIDNIVPGGGTPMRRAIYDSVKQIIEDNEIKSGHTRDGSVRAIVLLTDGGWNTGGDPRGIVSSIFGTDPYTELLAAPIGNDRGSVISWAKNNKIKIYTVALLGSDVSDQPNIAELQAYADETGGKAYVASSSRDLKGIYMDIAGALREEASVETKVNLDFSSMEVNSTYIYPGKEVMTYQHIEPDISTYIKAPNAGGVCVDNSTDWADSQVFRFSAGTIKVNEEWVVNFTMMVNTEGNIKILSSKTSKVTFVGTEGEVGIPDTFITSVPHGIEKGPEGIEFEIQGLKRTNRETDREVATLTWHPFYTGRDAKITYYIWLDTGYIESFQESKTVDPIYNLNIRDLPSGTHSFRVIGHVSDVNDKDATVKLIIPESNVPTQIKIGSNP